MAPNTANIRWGQKGLNILLKFGHTKSFSKTFATALSLQQPTTFKKHVDFSKQASTTSKANAGTARESSANKNRQVPDIVQIINASRVQAIATIARRTYAIV